MVLSRRSQSKHQSAFYTTHQTRDWNSYGQSTEYRPFVPIVLALAPGDKAEEGEDLWLDLKSDVEVLDDVVDAKRHSSTSPEEHHCWL